MSNVSECSDRDSDPGRRLERPICLAGLHHRSRAHPKAYKLIFNFLKSSALPLKISILNLISQKGTVTAEILYNVSLLTCQAIETGAVEVLIVSEEKFRTEPGRELLDLAENFGTSVHIISLTGEKGNIVKNFGGYCALLRYKI